MKVLQRYINNVMLMKKKYTLLFCLLLLGCNNSSVTSFEEIATSTTEPIVTEQAVSPDAVQATPTLDTEAPVDVDNLTDDTVLNLLEKYQDCPTYGFGIKEDSSDYIDAGSDGINGVYNERFCRVTNFNSVQEVRDYLSTFMTQDFIEYTFTPFETLFYEQDGKLYHTYPSMGTFTYELDYGYEWLDDHTVKLPHWGSGGEPTDGMDAINGYFVIEFVKENDVWKICNRKYADKDGNIL